ncbi:MAG: RHS repeat-associated core domain-containing protein, partial [Bacteroidales bacterium]|nr:RHS repeat-associated core domain-containing protein [Bacteroidales bacterium]
NNATITQGFLYAPFGEITTEYAPLWQNGTLPKYAFNAKELDEETGMFYYEARYYKPPVFTSRDAMMDQKPWLSPYHYCSNNPVGRVDPTGCDDDWWEVDGKMVWFANSDDFKNSKYEGKGEYKGKTYQKNGVYYSLFGQHMNANSTNGKITKQIDDAFIEYANYLAAEDEMFSPFDVECHDAIQELTDFSSININIPFNNSKATTGENIYYPNQMGTYAGTADIFYYVVGDKERMKGKLEGFSEGLIQSSKNGLGGPYGFDLGHYMGIYNYANSKYEKDNTIVILRFPQVSDVKNLQSKFYTLFPGSKK